MMSIGRFRFAIVLWSVGMMVFGAYAAIPACKVAATGVISPKDFLDRRICVSDTVRFTAASGCISCVDPEHAFVYSAHIISRTGHGENPHGLALARIPIAQMWRAQSWVLAERNQPMKGGSCYKALYDYYNIMNKGKVRTYFLGDGEHFCYIDFDPETETVLPERSVKCVWPGHAPEPLTSAPLKRYLEERGMKGFDLYTEPYEHLIVAMNPVWKDGGYYGVVTSPLSQPVVFFCRDGETFEFVGVIPAIGKYECPIAAVNGTMYALIRQVQGGADNFWLSDDWGRTWRPSGKIPHGTCRPQLRERGGKLLIFYSLADVKPNRVRNCRNNMVVLRGEGGDLSKYEEVFRVVDQLGFVQYDLVDYKGRLLCIWSNSELYPDKPQEWCHGLQGKDALFASWLDGL